MAAPECPLRPFTAPSLRRWAGAGLVLLLHGLIVLALLRAVVLENLPKKGARETTLVLLPLLEQPQKAAPAKAHGGSGPGAVSTPLPRFVNPTPPPPRRSASAKRCSVAARKICAT